MEPKYPAVHSHLKNHVPVKNIDVTLTYFYVLSDILYFGTFTKFYLNQLEMDPTWLKRRW